MCSKCRCRILGYFLIRVADHWGNTELLWTLILHTLITRAYAHWLKRGGAKFKNHSCPPIRAIWIFVIVFVLKEALSERIFYDYRLPIPACRNSWAMHKYASVYLLEAELFSTRQTNILAILASSETINIWGKRQLFWGKRQLASPCCNCINFFLPAYFEKQPGISLYRALSKCIAHASNFVQQ